MKPIVLIHGYSGESKDTKPNAIEQIYGSLPESLRKAYTEPTVVEIDLSRYVTLEDGVNLDDIARALDRALNSDKYKHLLESGFHVIIHSTGALVIRNWIRRFSQKPSPVRSVIYLAGANFGSGWAHIGKGQAAKWGRQIFQDGAERGLRVLDALELGSDWTIDLHRHFLGSGDDMYADYQVCEYVICGTQADAEWFSFPIRYAKEDGSDGVVRVSGSNVNFNYVRLEPTEEAKLLAWDEIMPQLTKHMDREGRRQAFYSVTEVFHPGQDGRPIVPLAIPFGCAHSGKDMGVVSGTKTRRQVLKLIKSALDTPYADWQACVAVYQGETDSTYGEASKIKAPAAWKKWLDNPREQYDHHAQVIFRLRDQDGRPVEHYDIFFDSTVTDRGSDLPIGKLFEDKHVNMVSPNIITFYLRTKAYTKGESDWIDQVARVKDCFLEITAVEPETDDIQYLPLRLDLTGDQLKEWIRDDQTTIVDVELLRLPSPKIYMLVT